MCNKISEYLKSKKEKIELRKMTKSVDTGNNLSTLIDMFTEIDNKEDSVYSSDSNDSESTKKFKHIKRSENLTKSLLNNF